MSLIEQAAKRLEELRRAGVEVPEVAQKPHDVTAPTSSTIEAATAKVRAGSAPSSRRAHAGLAAGQPAPPPEHGSEEPHRVHLDLAHLAKNGIVTPDAPRSQIADEFRV